MGVARGLTRRQPASTTAGPVITRGYTPEGTVTTTRSSWISADTCPYSTLDAPHPQEHLGAAPVGVHHRKVEPIALRPRGGDDEPLVVGAHGREAVDAEDPKRTMEEGGGDPRGEGFGGHGRSVARRRSRRRGARARFTWAQNPPNQSIVARAYPAGAW
jgi:hypothetical protein